MIRYTVFTMIGGLCNNKILIDNKVNKLHINSQINIVPCVHVKYNVIDTLHNNQLYKSHIYKICNCIHFSIVLKA